ncbi:3-dehydroquinate synthase [Fulvivirgaceae bacterium BMA12]|uniref:3-dehydroquinate synthase n=1 Tax=Agaribacillus aureus TaxID=3051825 RepID=A0ABT8L973_9BACT|nr:3-dehydroquinate synthase [Fulvivirgaceae bacterium BMA12]
MRKISQTFQVPFSYEVHFTRDLFAENNHLLKDLIGSARDQKTAKILVVVDEGVIAAHTQLITGITNYAHNGNLGIKLVCPPLVVPGGETVKNDNRHVKTILNAVNEFGLDRHAYLIAIGGGSVLDMAGFAATIAHRGIRHIRVPTTVLAQNDAGVGVKNGINQFGKKNFIGCFSPPFAVINDSAFLSTLEDRDWRCGITEAIKVALIKDRDFFKQIQQNTGTLLSRDASSMDLLIYQCAKLHLDHISRGGDPFEKGSSRPLDFGHWAAHKLEQLTDYRLRHGEAVAIGIALDSIYSQLIGLLSQAALHEILTLFKNLKFKLFVPELLADTGHKNPVMDGLNEFREHLGGKLTIMLLKDIGEGVEVNDIDYEQMQHAILELKKFDEETVPKC